MRRIGALLLLILAFPAESLTKDDNGQVTNTSSELLKWSKNITKRESGCPEGQQRQGNFCCLPCLPGERKNRDCSADGDKLVCVPCLERVEYTDKEHYSDKCRRCRICDGEQGLEVEKNCTKTQNTKCRCKSNFFCDTLPCEHCNPCSTCEHGIVEDCTPTNDTRCKEGSRSQLNALWCLILVPISAVILWFFMVKRRRRNKDGCHEPAPPAMSEVDLADIDLGDYISTIADQMTISEVKEFVRKNGTNEAKIDEIKNDNPQNTADQKILLLRYWYQVHGKKNAYLTLMEGLRKASLCALADRIKDIVQNNIDSKHENANIKNANESQSLV